MIQSASYLQAFAVTLLAEALAVYLYARTRKLPSMRMAGFSLPINLLTHPLFSLWLGSRFQSSQPGAAPWVMIGEAAVFAVEAALYALLLKEYNRNWAKGLQCSFLANSASYLIGRMLPYPL